MRVTRIRIDVATNASIEHQLESPLPGTHYHLSHSLKTCSHSQASSRVKRHHTPVQAAHTVCSALDGTSYSLAVKLPIQCFNDVDGDRWPDDNVYYGNLYLPEIEQSFTYNELVLIESENDKMKNHISNKSIYERWQDVFEMK